MRPGAIAILLALPLAAQQKPIDTQRSTITIHVGKSGLLSAAGHEHIVDAPIASGTIQENGEPHIEFTVQTAKMTVRFDPKVGPATQDAIQKDMDELTLDTKKFPEIVFRSTHAERLAGGDWKVDGNLSLHGVTKPVTVRARQMPNSFTGHTFLKQTDFGIKPVTAAGGTIRVKNEIEIEFEIFPAK